MTKFSNIPLFICLLHLFACKLNNADKADSQERKGFYLKARIGHWKHEGVYNYLPVFTTLINNSVDTIRYLSLSCSWDMSYTIDDIHLTRSVPGCNRNVPNVITIFPKSSDQEKAILFQTKEDTSSFVGRKFRVGFNYIPFTTYANFDNDVKKLFKHSNLIWTDTLPIK